MGGGVRYWVAPHGGKEGGLARPATGARLAVAWPRRAHVGAVQDRGDAPLMSGSCDIVTGRGGGLTAGPVGI
jgi:hypothetical protein